MPAAWRARRAARRIRCSWASRPTWGGCFDPVPAVTAPRELARVLTLRDLVLIVVGTTIGSGIFTVPGAVLRQSGGDLGVALLVWLLGSVLALLGALTFGELGAMLPDAGGSYVYVRDAFGPLPAFLLGWTLFLAINSGGTATLAVAFANYLGELVPLAPAAHKLAAVAMIAAVAAVNIRGVRQAASVQNWSTALKVGALLALAVAGVALGDGFRRSDARVFTTSLSFASFSAAGVALLGVLWAYEGWQNVTNSAGEARDPQRTFARGIGFGTAALVAMYTDGERRLRGGARRCRGGGDGRSEEHTSELKSLAYLVCRLLLEKKKAHIHRDFDFQHVHPVLRLGKFPHVLRHLRGFDPSEREGVLIANLVAVSNNLQEKGNGVGSAFSPHPFDEGLFDRVDLLRIVGIKVQQDFDHVGAHINEA